MSSLDTGGGDENTQTHTHTRPNGLVNVAHVRRYSFNTDSSSSPSTTPGSLNTSIGTGGAAGYDDEGAAFLLARLEAQKNDPKPVSGFDPFSFIRTSFNAVRDSMNAQEEKTATEEEMDWGKQKNHNC